MQDSPYLHYANLKERNIEKYLNHNSFSEQMKNDLRNFRIKYSEARKLAMPSQESYVRSIGTFGLFLVEKGITDFSKATKEQINEYVDGMRKDGKSESVQMWGRLSIKVFYRWLFANKKNKKGEPQTKGLGKKDAFPELVNWIVVGMPKPPSYKPEDFLTPEEVKTLIMAAKNQRDRALLYLLFDSGCRIGEILNLKVADVHLEENYPYIYPQTSKTEPRPVYLKDCIHDLRAWIEAHPEANKPNFSSKFLFVPLRQEKERKQNRVRLPYLTMNKVLENIKRIGIAAGIKKRVWAHEFRHMRITQDKIMGIPDDMNRTARGLAPNSRILDRYSHANPNEYAKMRRKMTGESVPEEDNPFKAKTCFRCKESNDWASNFCKRCASPLSPEAFELAKNSQAMFDKIKVLDSRMNEFEKLRFNRAEPKIRKK